MDLTAQYLGLTLKNPIIVGSSGLTGSVEKIKDMPTTLRKPEPMRSN